MGYAIQFRTTQFFRIKTKYPINTEFFTLKTFKIHLKLSNSRKTINGRNVIQPSDVNEMYTVTGSSKIGRYFNVLTQENFIKYTKK